MIFFCYKLSTNFANIAKKYKNEQYLQKTQDHFVLSGGW